LIIVPLLKGIQEMGWLVAINRLVVPTDENVPLGMSDLEFGTVEAGLLASAASMLATQASNVELFVAKEGLLVGVVRAMVSALDAKDPYTCGHSERVALVGQRLARQLGLDERYCNQLYLTGLLHDIGKIGISDAVLSKPGKLSDQEFDEIKRHPDQGWLILHDLDPLNYVLPGVLHHHESYNGTGYPDQLAGDEIPLDARILAVADAYDAMSSDRPYRKGMDAEKVDAILRAGAGTQWDARVIEAFFTARDEIRTISESYRPRAIASRRKQQAEQAAAKVREDFSSKAEAVATLKSRVSLRPLARYSSQSGCLR
jgi:HD-GYP domain-containing protein (c-di-GMP phosphodiesterase class II)